MDVETNVSRSFVLHKGAAAWVIKREGISLMRELWCKCALSDVDNYPTASHASYSSTATIDLCISSYVLAQAMCCRTARLIYSCISSYVLAQAMWCRTATTELCLYIFLCTSASNVLQKCYDWFMLVYLPVYKRNQCVAEVLRLIYDCTSSCIQAQAMCCSTATTDLCISSSALEQAMLCRTNLSESKNEDCMLFISFIISYILFSTFLHEEECCLKEPSMTIIYSLKKRFIKIRQNVQT